MLVALLCITANVSKAAPRFDLSTTANSTQNNAQPDQLLKQQDIRLQQRVNAVVNKDSLRKAIADKRLSVALVDITNLQDPRYASINGDTMMYAASLPKIALLLGAYEVADRNHQAIDETKFNTLVNMIRYSSNKAATEIYEDIGPATLANILQSKRYQLYNKEQNGGLWVGRPYAKAQAWKRDPLHNISHGATANQVARFYYMLETGKLVSPAASSEMKQILSEPGINHKFVRGLSGRPGSKIFRKSGSWRNYHADSAIVERDGKRYIAVVLAHDNQGGKWIEQLIGTFDDVIHATPNLLAGHPVEKPLS